MFSKDSEKLESLLGDQSDFQGELNVKGTLRVDGRVQGRVNADCVILSETAVFKGEVIAQKIIVGGKIEGTLRAEKIIEIKGKGNVLGDIFTPKLSVTEGGEFNGKIQMKMDESRVVELTPQLQKA